MTMTAAVEPARAALSDCNGDFGSGAVNAELLTLATEVDWNDYVAAHPLGTIFHELAYRNAVQRAYGHRAVYFLARSGGTVCGALPMFLVESRIAGRMLVSMPYAIYGGPLADNADAEFTLRTAAMRAAAARAAGLIDWRNSSPPPHAGAGLNGEKDGDPSAHRWTRVANYVTFRRDLPEAPHDVAAWLPRKARAAARRAMEKNELTVSWDAGEWPIVWQLYCRSMRRLGSINYSRRFFEALVDEMSMEAAAYSPKIPSRGSNDSARQLLLQVVRSGGRPVAGLLTFVHRGVALPYFVGIDERAEIYGLNNFLYFLLMQKAVEIGCRTFDFGRSRIDNTGSCDFKRFHGFEPTPLAYERFVADGAADPQLTPSNPRFALARRVWPRLPLSVTQPLGEWLSRSIPG